MNREWPREALPGGTVTFLMTDVVDSSELWDADAELMDAAVRLLDELVHDAADGRDGVVIKPRGEGDSHFVVHRRASDAVLAAVDLQRAVSAAEWPAGFELSVRAAVHTGEAEARDGDYYGIVVNRTARLRSVAHGGQILISRVVADLARARLRDVQLTALGTLEIRSWPEPQELFQVCAEAISEPA